MRRQSGWVALGVLLAGVLGTGAAAQAAPPPEEAGVRAALEHYMQGHATGDGAHMRAAFAPGAQLFWVQQGELRARSAEEFAAGFNGQAAPDEAQRRRWVEDIRITGNAAAATVVLDYPTVRFTDYMSLLKIGDEWRIVNKTYTAQPKARPADS